MGKKELMKELLDRYQQLESLEGDTCKSSRTTLSLYIRKQELRLASLLESGHSVSDKEEGDYNG